MHCRQFNHNAVASHEEKVGKIAFWNSKIV